VDATDGNRGIRNIQKRIIRIMVNELGDEINDYDAILHAWGIIVTQIKLYELKNVLTRRRI